jgi:hypothetical protein
MARLFISLPRLDGWIEQGLVSIDNGRMMLTDGKNFRLVSAVLFRSVVGGEEDPHRLLGKVLTGEGLTALSAEHYKDSVLIGEIGYQVLEGFVGEAE